MADTIFHCDDPTFVIINHILKPTTLYPVKKSISSYFVHFFNVNKLFKFEGSSKDHLFKVFAKKLKKKNETERHY